MVSFPAIAEEDEIHWIKARWERGHSGGSAGDVSIPSVNQHDAGGHSPDNRVNTTSPAIPAEPYPARGSHGEDRLATVLYTGRTARRFSRIVQSWDTANKAAELNDYSVCTTWGVKQKHIYLLHVLRRRVCHPVRKSVQWRNRRGRFAPKKSSLKIKPQAHS